jgi:hypothetical protein
MAVKKDKLGKNSVISEFMHANYALEWIDPPPGVELRHEADKLTWAQWSMSRLVEDWTVSDLSQLGRVIKMEVDLRELWDEVHGEGIMLENEETQKKYENPIIATIDRIQKAQLSIIRSMGLNTPTTDPRVMQRAVENVRNHQATAEKNKGSLLAQPHH